MTPPLLHVRGLSIGFGAGNPVLDAVDLDVARGEVVGLVGESGSGKSLLATAIAGILDVRARLRADRLAFGGADLLAAGIDPWRDLRGREIGMVWQNPRAALNPTRRIVDLVADVIQAHRPVPRARLRGAVIEALAEMRISDPAGRLRAYPAELSGGMCQRVVLAIALAGNPSLLIADEPTTGLDATTQAAVLDLLLSHARERRMATLLITHDLALARQACERIVVLHAGQVAEDSPAAALFSEPRHPYAARLLSASPAYAATLDQLRGIGGAMPDLRAAQPACRFARRCARADAACDAGPIPSIVPAPGRRVVCLHPL